MSQDKDSHELIHAMDWLPTLATMAGITIPAKQIMDGRDIQPLLLGVTDAIPDPTKKLSLNAEVPLRRPWNPPAEWAQQVTQSKYLNAFFYHGAEGQLAAVRSTHPQPSAAII